MQKKALISAGAYRQTRPANVGGDPQSTGYVTMKSSGAPLHGTGRDLAVETTAKSVLDTQ
jgi:hypothetical protein